MKRILLIIALTLVNNLFYGANTGKQLSINTGNSAATTNIKVMGVDIFVGCKPLNKYSVIDQEKIKIEWNRNPYHDLEKAVKKAKKKNPQITGIIFYLSTKHIAEYIVFL